MLTLKIMDATDFKNKLEQLTAISKKHGWQILSTDAKCGRVSFKDDLSIFRVDIYTSKMTVCLLPSGDKPVYLKRQNFDTISKLLANPYGVSA